MYVYVYLMYQYMLNIPVYTLYLCEMTGAK